MALSIAETPVLTGKYAVQFQRMMEDVEYASDEEIEDLKKTYNRIKTECKFK